MKGARPEAQIERAQAEVEQAKRRLASTLGALQYRLKPGTLMNQAWEGVREKGGAVADDAMQAVKDRPAAVSGVIAASLLFLARDPLRRLAGRLFGGKAAREEPGIVKADLDHPNGNFDLAAPTVARSMNEGVNA
ncbi:MAG TPA: DUF3618 domain-containing protein [Allosphingosinicella sp.]|nr:DUF3618 domain-containing protein [Allosphingosinicella sp.]